MDEPATEVEEGFEGRDSQLVLPLNIWKTTRVPELEWMGVLMGCCTIFVFGVGLLQLPDERDDSVGAFEAFE